MKYIKLFENYNNDSWFDSLVYKGTKLYRGVGEREYNNFKENGEILGSFFSEDLTFAEDYGDYIISGVLDTSKVFNSLDLRNIKKLYDGGYKLFDNHSETTFNTFDEYTKLSGDSDTWDVIENSEGVLDYLTSRYDAILITEGGVGNFYIESPNTFLKNIKEEG